MFTTEKNLTLREFEEIYNRNFFFLYMNIYKKFLVQFTIKYYIYY